MNYYLGSLATPAVSEHERQMIFVRWFNPTDLDKAINALYKQIQAINLPGWDYWAEMGPGGLVGFEGANIENFLQAYINVSRDLGYVLTAANSGTFKTMINSEYGIPAKNLDVYLDVMLKAKASGTIPDTIYMPFTYEPSEALEPGEALTPAVVRSASTLALVAAVGATLYLFGPSILKSLKKGLKPA